MLPNLASAFYGGPEEFQTQIVCELASDKDEIVAVVPLKAEGAPVQGAGFSPEAVPGNSAENEEHQNETANFEESRQNLVVSTGTRSKNLFEGFEKGVGGIEKLTSRTSIGNGV